MFNKKGLVGQLLIFVVVTAIASGFIFAVYKSGNQTAAEVFYNDDLRSVSLVADAVISSPGCFLHAETDNQFQPPKIVAGKGTLDWDKITATSASANTHTWTPARPAP